MALRGWVYVITNKSMPGLIKIGFSTKDPLARAEELGTGSPHPYQVEYDILVDDPQSIEQRLHQIFSHKREGKEWFRCSISEAVNKIRAEVQGHLITEKLRAPLADNLSSYTPNYHTGNRAYSISKLKEEMEQIARERKEKENDS
jgi:hypothetical protein